MSHRLFIMAVTAWCAVTVHAATYLVEDFELRPGLGPNSRTFHPPGRATTTYVAGGIEGRWAAQIHVPACQYGFWQLTGRRGVEIAAARPTAFVLWHRAIDKPARFRVVLREKEGERWTADITAQPGEWQRTAVPLDKLKCIGGGESDKKLDLAALAVFQFRFDRVAEPMTFQVDNLCFTSEPNAPAARILAAAEPPLAVENQFGRLVANLGGAWGFMPVKELRYPPKGRWHKMRIAKTQVCKRSHWGKYSKEWAKATCGWYRRQIDLPEEFVGRRIKVKFMAVHAEADVWCNGIKVGRHVGGLTPFEVDITDAAKLGQTNEILVACRGPLDKRIETQPRGAMYRYHAGIWQKVLLEARARVFVDNVFIITSVREKTLTLRTTLRNEDSVEQEARVSHDVLDGATVVKRVPGKRARIKPGETITVEQQIPWADAKLWSFETPHLYTLRTDLTGPSGLREGRSTRFGFREFWIDGHMFRLNGAKVRIKATWGHSGEWYYGRPQPIAAKLRVLKQYHLNAVRYHGQLLPPEFLDAADKVGMMVIAESGLYHGPVHPNSLVHTREWILRDRNHPSIVIWSGSNEFGHWIVPRDKTRTAFLLKQEALIRSLDPTRPIMQHGYGPLDGKEEIYNIHYPERALAMMPNTFYWPLDPNIEINPAYPDFTWRQEKPLAIGEHLLGCDGQSSLFEGDTAYGKGRDWSAAARVFSLAMNAYRVCGVAHVAPQVFQSSPDGKSVPNPYLEGIAQAFKPEGMFFVNLCRHYRGRETLRKTVVVYNETLREQTYEWTWGGSVGPTSVRTLGQTWERVRLEPGDLRRLEAAADLPSVEGLSKGRLVVGLRRAGEHTSLQTINVDISISPPLAKIALSKPVGLYDPRRTTAARLAALGVKAKPIRSPSAAALRGLHLLVIGKDALTEKIEEQASAIAQFVRSGGNVICLEQQVMPRWLPVPLQLVSARGSPTETAAFVRDGQHPILANLRNAAPCSAWRDNHVVTRLSMYKPAVGNFIPLVDSNLKLERCPMIEIPNGRGAYIVSQLALVSKFDREPMAATLLANALKYLDQRQPKEWPSVAVLAEENSHFADALRSDIKAQFTQIASAAALPKSGVALLDAGELTMPNAHRLRTFAEAGGTVLVQAAKPGDEARLQKLLAAPVSLEAAQAAPVSLIKGPEGTRGISNYDLAWESKQRGKLSTERIKWRVTINRTDVTQWIDMAGALAEMPLGKGKVVINQFRWDRETYDTTRAQRFASILLTNLGVQIRALSLVPVSEKGYFFVDIRKFCNGRLKTAHGNDLARLPTGKQEFRGVPFWIIPHGQNKGLGSMGLNNALVLPDGTRIDGNASLPMHVVGIPVRKRVGKLVFLHLAGFSHSKTRYAKSKIAEYVVNYRGGAKERIPVRAQIEVTNWWNQRAQDLPNAKVAWKGSNARTDKIAVYMLEWANPFPEREVESIDFRSAGNPAWSPSCLAISGLEVE